MAQEATRAGASGCMRSRRARAGCSPPRRGVRPRPRRGSPEPGREGHGWQRQLTRPAVVGGREQGHGGTQRAGRGSERGGARGSGVGRLPQGRASSGVVGQRWGAAVVGGGAASGGNCERRQRRVAPALNVATQLAGAPKAEAAYSRARGGRSGGERGLGQGRRGVQGWRSRRARRGAASGAVAVLGRSRERGRSDWSSKRGACSGDGSAWRMD